MNTIRIHNTELNTPSSYNELSAAQLLDVCKQLLTRSKLTPFALLFSIFGAKRGILFPNKRTKFLKSLPPEALTYFANDQEVTGWIYQPPKLTNYIIPSFRIGLTKYHGPHTDMLNINVAEFVEVSMYYGAYLNSLNTGPDISLIDKMLAVLYRPGRLFYAFEKNGPNFTLDRRVKNNEYRFAKRASLFKTLNPALKMALFLQYEGALEAFAQHFPNAFSASGATSGGNDTAGWVKLLMSMSGDIFGDYEKTQSVDVFTFFTKVDSNIEQAKEMEKKYKKK